MIKGNKITNGIPKGVFTAIKLLVVLFTLIYIYFQVVRKNGATEFQTIWLSLTNNSAHMWLMVLVVLLMPVNWGIEAFKWKKMIDRIQRISFRHAFMAIFLGTTVSFFTPNRVGEFAGRILMLPGNDKIRPTLVTILCSMAQLTVTLLMGLFSFIFYFKILFAPTELNIYLLLCSLVFISGVIILILFLNSHLLTAFLKRFKLTNHFHRYTRVFSYFSSKQLAFALLLSFTRYIIFSLQFYIVLIVLSVDIPLWPFLEMIALTYLAIAIVPTFALSEIGVRGSAAIYFIGTLSSNTAGIASASFIIWAINIVTPALLGSLFLYNLKFSEN